MPYISNCQRQTTKTLLSCLFLILLSVFEEICIVSVFRLSNKKPSVKQRLGRSLEDDEVYVCNVKDSETSQLSNPVSFRSMAGLSALFRMIYVFERPRQDRCEILKRLGNYHFPAISMLPEPYDKMMNRNIWNTSRQWRACVYTCVF